MRILAIIYHPSVRLSITLCSFVKMVQARITKFSLWAPTRTLYSFFVTKFFVIVCLSFVGWLRVIVRL